MTAESKGILPSLAIKFLISNTLSTNLFGMPNFTGKDEEGNESWDFFHRPLKSRVERFERPCERDSVEKKLIEGSPVPYATSVVFPAFYDTSDYLNPQIIDHRAEDSDFRFPYQLEYEGKQDLFPNDREETWYNRMKQHFNPFVEAGEEEPFIEVYAWAAPPTLGGKRVKIADLVLKSKIYTSKTGDQRLFFQHKRVKKDMKVWPNEWKALDHHFQRFDENGLIIPEFPGINNWPTTDAAAEEKFLQLDEGGYGCPFSWLFRA